MAQIVLDKYASSPEWVTKDKLLPVLSNQKMNSYLKEIGDVCRINKVITFHLVRHTFATTITLTNGVPIESVSKMLGHRNIKTTQHYAKIVDKKISDDMARLGKVLITNKIFLVCHAVMQRWLKLWRQLSPEFSFLAKWNINSVSLYYD